MTRLTLTIDMDNDAFADDPGYEVARLLEKLARDVREDAPRPGWRRSLRDANGNWVGVARCAERQPRRQGG